jgi:hypothetical protein
MNALHDFTRPQPSHCIIYPCRSSPYVFVVHSRRMTMCFGISPDEHRLDMERIGPLQM